MESSRAIWAPIPESEALMMATLPRSEESRDIVRSGDWG